MRYRVVGFEIKMISLLSVVCRMTRSCPSTRTTLPCTAVPITGVPGTAFGASPTWNDLTIVLGGVRGAYGGARPQVRKASGSAVNHIPRCWIRDQNDLFVVRRLHD